MPGRVPQTVLRPPDRINALNRWMQDYAAKNGHFYLDYFSAMSDEKGLLKPELTADGLHFNPAGYAIMSPLAEKAIAKALAK
jgi:lysophospholipase L1-like esterase